MANELPEVGAFNQQPTLADIGKSSAATSLGSIGSLINLASRNLDPNAEQMFRELSGSDSVETDLPDIESFKEMFGAPESLNIGDFVSIDPFSKVLATGKGIMAAGKGIMAMLPYITASGLNVTKRLETIGQIRNRAISTRNAARSSENPKLKEAEYKEADRLDLEAKRLEDSLSTEDLINEKNHRAAQSTKEGAEKALAEIRKNLGIDPKKKISKTPFKKVTPENYDSLLGGYQFDATLLAYPRYAAFKGKKMDIVDMTPNEYIKKSAKLFNTSPKMLEKNRIENTAGFGGQEFIDKLKNSMKKIMEGKKVKLDGNEYDSFAPVALYANKQQEGLHRAIAAKQLGIKKIPVIVEKNIKRVDQGAGYNYFKDADKIKFNQGGSVDKALYTDQKYI